MFDGDCPLCVREVDFLRIQDGGRGKLDLVDIAADDYSPVRREEGLGGTPLDGTREKIEQKRATSCSVVPAHYLGVFS